MRHLLLMLLLASPLPAQEPQIVADSVRRANAPCTDNDRMLGLPCRMVDTVYIVERPLHREGLKDGSTAVLFSLLIPGGGQFYAGEGGAGAGYLLTSVAAVGIGYGLSREGCSRYQCRADQTPLYVGLGTGLLISLISVFDASAAVDRHNKKVRLIPTGLSLNF